MQRTLSMNNLSVAEGEFMSKKNSYESSIKNSYSLLWNSLLNKEIEEIKKITKDLHREKKNFELYSRVIDLISLLKSNFTGKTISNLTANVKDKYYELYSYSKISPISPNKNLDSFFQNEQSIPKKIDNNFDLDDKGIIRFLFDFLRPYKNDQRYHRFQNLFFDKIVPPIILPNPIFNIEKNKIDLMVSYPILLD